MNVAQKESATPEPRVDLMAKLLGGSKQFGALVALVLLFGIVLFDVWQLKDFYLLLFGASSDLEDVFGLNKWIAAGLATVLISPLLWAIKRELTALSRQEDLSLKFQVLFCAYACVFFGVMYWVEKEAPFHHGTGEARQFYGVSLDGQIRMYDSAGFDTTTGEPLKKVTKEIIYAFRQQEAGLRPLRLPADTFPERLYDETTGAPRVWYARHPDGHFSLYDRPGYDAILGVTLKPVTPEAASEIRGWFDRKSQADRQNAQNAAFEIERSAQREKDARAAAARLAFIERYIDRNARRVAGMSTVAVRLIESNDANSVSVAHAMDRALRDRGFNVVPLFKPAFGREGLDRQLFDGSPSLAQRLDLAQHCDSVVIGSVRMVMPPRNAGGMYITEMALQLKQISAAGVQIAQTQVQEKGGALDARSSVSAALEKLAESAEATMAAWPGT